MPIAAPVGLRLGLTDDASGRLLEAARSVIDLDLDQVHDAIVLQIGVGGGKLSFYYLVQRHLKG